MEDMDFDAPEMQRFPRSEAEYISQDERFELKKQKFQGQQCSQLYDFRLRHAKQHLLPIVKKQWPTLPVFNILALQEGRGCVVIGTLYKEMRLKPSILNEYSKEEENSLPNGLLGLLRLKKTGDSKYVALVSGLRVGVSDTNPLQLQLLVDHLTGHLGGGEATTEPTLSAQIVRCVIAGDSIQLQASHLAGQPLSLKHQRKLSEPMRELDVALTWFA